MNVRSMIWKWCRRPWTAEACCRFPKVQPAAHLTATKSPSSSEHAAQCASAAIAAAGCMHSKDAARHHSRIIRVFVCHFIRGQTRTSHMYLFNEGQTRNNAGASCACPIPGPEQTPTAAPKRLRSTARREWCTEDGGPDRGVRRSLMPEQSLGTLLGQMILHRLGQVRILRQIGRGHLVHRKGLRRATDPGDVYLISDYGK